VLSVHKQLVTLLETAMSTENSWRWAVAITMLEEAKRIAVLAISATLRATLVCSAFQIVQ